MPRLCGCRRRCASIGQAEKETDIAASQEEEEDRAKKSERRSFPILETNSRTDRIPSHSHCEPRCLGNTSGMIISFRLIIDTLVRWKVRDDHFSSLSIPRPVPLFLSLAGSSRVGRVRSSRCGVDDESPYRVPLPRSSILRNHPHARPLSLCRSAPVRSGTLFCNIVLLQPQRCVSSLREILTRIEYKKIYNARSIIMKQAGASSPRFT